MVMGLKGLFKKYLATITKPSHRDSNNPKAIIQMPKPILHRHDFSAYLDQNKSPLFSVIPPEIRNAIFAFALSDFEDIDNAYSTGSFWARPGYYGPRRACTELLRTCKRAYMEAWYLPFAYAEHSFHLGLDHRVPSDARLWRNKFQKCLNTIHTFHGKVEAGHVRVFAQLHSLEPGESLQQVLNMKHFHPKSITLTIRYTDFWHWEENVPLHINARWVNVVRFPNTVTEFTIDFESIKRREGEVHYIADGAADNWHFQRNDGVILTPRKNEALISKWTGSSVLGGFRWLRDEARPGQLDYHIVSVTWRVSKETVTDRPLPEFDNVTVPSSFPRPEPPQLSRDRLDEYVLRSRRIPHDTPAEKAIMLATAGDQRRLRGR